VIVLALVLFGAAELAAFVVVAEQIGLLAALALLIVVSLLGPLVVRRVGLGVMAHTRARLDAGEPPTAELLDGLVVLVGGLLICVPGFIGDVLGLLLMLSPVRRLVIGLAGHHLAHRVRQAEGRRWQVIDVDTRSAPGRAPWPGAGPASLRPPGGDPPPPGTGTGGG
jgi:UPF0716 family protein affecting phage T7 exclusion